MKKLLSVVAIALMTLAAVGCGNSPDGDSQRVSSTIVAPMI